MRGKKFKENLKNRWGLLVELFKGGKYQMHIHALEFNKAENLLAPGRAGCEGCAAGLQEINRKDLVIVPLWFWA